MSKQKIDQWKALHKKAEENKAKEQGRYETLMQRMKELYDYEKLEDLEAEIAQVKIEIEENRAALAKGMEDFEHEHLAKLEAAAR